jgi:hypothetical protein
VSLAACVVCAIGLAWPAARPATTAPVVTPAEPAPTQPVTIAFTAPSTVDDGSRWYSVSVTAPSRSSGCEFYEETTTTSAHKGRRVSVVLRPVDKGRWCAGEYTGEVNLESRTRCGDRIDEYTCSDDRRLAGVHFTVAG